MDALETAFVEALVQYAASLESQENSTQKLVEDFDQLCDSPANIFRQVLLSIPEEQRIRDFKRSETLIERFDSVFDDLDASKMMYVNQEPPYNQCKAEKRCRFRPGASMHRPVECNEHYACVDHKGKSCLICLQKRAKKKEDEEKDRKEKEEKDHKEKEEKDRKEKEEKDRKEKEEKDRKEKEKSNCKEKTEMGRREKGEKFNNKKDEKGPEGKEKKDRKDQGAQPSDRVRDGENGVESAVKPKDGNNRDQSDASSKQIAFEVRNVDQDMFLFEGEDVLMPGKEICQVRNKHNEPVWVLKEAYEDLKEAMRKEREIQDQDSIESILGSEDRHRQNAHIGESE